MSKASKQPRLLLYKHDASPPSRAVMMLGNILGLKFDYKEPDLLNLEQKTPDYKKINPMGTIPVLEDGDFIISESHAIMTYLVGKYGADQKERLYPSELQSRAIIDQRMFYNAGVVFIRLKIIALPMIFKDLEGPSQAQLDDVDEAYSALEAYLQNNKYIAANHLTLADLSLGSTASAMQVIHKLDENRFPRCAEWLASLRNEDFFIN